MNNLTQRELTDYIEANIGTYHEKLLKSLSKLKLPSLLSKKNPYLFRAKSLTTASEMMKAVVDAFLSSQEETIFGDWLEGLAIFVNQKVYNGRKSSTKGIDLEFEKDGTRYLVAIKSGPNWGNSSQVQKMILDFKSASKTLNTSGHKPNIELVNGCCYGRDNKPRKLEYYEKLCGQRFWEFISGDENLYLEIIEPLGDKTLEKSGKFNQLYDQILAQITHEFSTHFCKEDQTVDWVKLLKYNSSTQKSDKIKFPKL